VHEARGLVDEVTDLRVLVQALEPGEGGRVVANLRELERQRIRTVPRAAERVARLHDRGADQVLLALVVRLAVRDHDHVHGLLELTRLCRLDDQRPEHLVLQGRAEGRHICCQPVLGLKAYT
jgi:hypothetical protein